MMRNLLLALLVSSFTMPIGMGGALAGGAPDSSGEGYHCFMLFEHPTQIEEPFVQAFMNNEDPEETVLQRAEALQEYIIEEGYRLISHDGNIPSSLGKATDKVPDLEVKAIEEALYRDHEILTNRICSSTPIKAAAAIDTPKKGCIPNSLGQVSAKCEIKAPPRWVRSLLTGADGPGFGEGDVPTGSQERQGAT